jgi:hypothetical protein
MQRVDNWQDITPPEGEGEEEEETTEESVQTTLPERTEDNTAPIANDYQYGVRPGRTTVLPVLENDTDADGDVLVASVEREPSFGTIEPIHNGAALQITVPEDATGSTTFTYEVDDGRRGTDTASVTVTVRPLDQNSPPVQRRKTSVPVETGGTASYNVLSDWIDPDGDDIFLLDVVPDGGDEAAFTSDGQITYRAIGGVQGRKDFTLAPAAMRGKLGKAGRRVGERGAMSGQQGGPGLAGKACQAAPVIPHVPFGRRDKRG